MTDSVIRVEGLSKQYRIGAPQASYRTLRDTLVDVAMAPIRRVRFAARRHTHRLEPENTVWALQNVSFEIKQGQVVGIIGRNGAGKSTLLKILSRITEPTRGRAEIHGRVGSLLEVGTGFHSELTGRENIFLNGAILGMKRSDIQRNFDAIVAFAEVERFVDTPVKYYSSGMYLRLAFSVAAYLQPDILLIDEVLAVGDAVFQTKCLGKMSQVAQEGRTVLFVSHNMAAVRSLCSTGILLEKGRVKQISQVGKCIERYTHSIRPDLDPEHDSSAPFGFGPILINGQPEQTVLQGEPVTLSTSLRIGSRATGMFLFLVLEDAGGRTVLHLREDIQLQPESGKKGPLPVHVELPALWLNPGLYTLYFKALPWTADGNCRFDSERFVLDVCGVSSNAESVLNPRAKWTLS